MNKDPLNDDKLVSNARHLLNQSVSELDADTSERLEAARRKALAQTECKQAAHRPALEQIGNMLTAPYAAIPRPVAMAASLILATGATVFWLNQASPLREDFVQALEDVAMLSTGDEPGLYEEIDFYLWLEGYEQRG